MKSTQLLSVVLSLIMVTGVSTGAAAFAESDEYYDGLEDAIEDYCDMTDAEKADAISDYSELSDNESRLSEICSIDDIDERYDALFDFADEIVPETRDDVEDDFDEVDDEFDDVIEDFEDCVEAGYPIMESYPEQCMTDDGTVFVNDEDDDDAYDDDDYEKVLVCHKNGKTLSISESALRAHLAHGDSEGRCDGDVRHHDIEDRLAHWCSMSDEEKRQFFVDHPRFEQFSDRLANYCDMSDYSRDNKIKDFIRLHVTDEDRDRVKHYVKDKVTDYVKDHVRDYVKDGRHFDLDKRLGYFCEMSDEEKRQFFADHPRLEQFSDRLANWCDLSGDERKDRIKDFVRDHVKDADRDRNVDVDFRHALARYCEMSDEDKRAHIAEHDKAADKVEKMDRYCSLGESDRAGFIAEHRDEYRDHMKDRMHDKVKDHMNYDRLCSMTALDRAAEVTDVAKLDRISKWCDMTPGEREDYKREHHDSMKDRVTDHMKDRMDPNMKDRMMDNSGKGNAKDRVMASDMSPRLKAMIMEKHGISDERMDEIKMKYREKHGERSDEIRSEIKMKFKDHMSRMEIKISDERKSAIHDRLSEMRDFKAELRDRASDMTDEERQELRADFIERAKDMQLAWISPRVQMHAGVDAADIECREGFSLVMKASNGVSMCLKADTALKMIDRGIVVPAN